MMARLKIKNKNGQYSKLISWALVIIVFVVIITVVRSNLKGEDNDIKSLLCSTGDYDEDGLLDTLDDCICNKDMSQNCELDCENPIKKKEFLDKKNKACKEAAS
jgi:hypothetical protein